VLSQTFSTAFHDTPTALFQRLARINPSPYMFLLTSDRAAHWRFSRALRESHGQSLRNLPIAGTVRRGDTALEDAAKVQELIGSLKDESELTMCTDVDRNDMARVCVPGSVKVIGRRQLEFYSHLIHTVDHLEGYLRPEFDSLDAFQTHMWACTVTGSPKPAAMQEIENLEVSPRGWYSGAVGFLSFAATSTPELPSGPRISKTESPQFVLELLCSMGQIPRWRNRRLGLKQPRSCRSRREGAGTNGSNKSCSGTGSNP
jgi:anthranilate synthase